MILPEGQICRVTFLLFALKVCFTKYSMKEWIWLTVFVVFTGFMYFVTGQNVALRSVFFVAAMRDIEIMKAMKYTFWLTLGGSILLVILSFFDMGGRGISTTEVFRGGEITTRYHFGFGHPNTFHCGILMLLLLFLYCYHKKLNWQAYLSLLVANFGLSLLTGSQTGFAICSLAILVAMGFHVFPKLRSTNGVYWAGMLVLLFCVGVSILAAVYADHGRFWTEGSWAERLDSIFTGRIKELHFGAPSVSARAAEWTLFGGNATFNYRFDMGWVRLFYWFGIIPAALFVISHLLLLNECRRQKDYMALVMITIVAIYTVVEGQFISLFLGRNSLLFLFGMYWGAMLMTKSDEYPGEELNWWRLLRHRG
jgi:hypothetical protein